MSDTTKEMLGAIAVLIIIMIMGWQIASMNMATAKQKFLRETIRSEMEFVRHDLNIYKELKDIKTTLAEMKGENAAIDDMNATESNGIVGLLKEEGE